MYDLSPHEVERRTRPGNATRVSHVEGRLLSANGRSLDVLAWIFLLAAIAYITLHVIAAIGRAL